MTTTGVTVTGTITPTGSVHAAAGSVGNPSLAFNADQNTGLYNIGADNIGVAAGGSKVLDIATTGLGVTGTLSVSGVATLGAGAILNTPASGTLTNATGLPISTGVSGLGTGVATFLATPSSANLLAAVTNETGTGALVFGTSPTLTTPISATLTSPAATNLTLGTTDFGAAITVASATGKVGIGTATPQGALTVKNANDDAFILLGNNASLNGSLGSVKASYNGDIAVYKVAAAIDFIRNESSDGKGGDIYFKTNAATESGATTKMVVNGAGNVLIGTTDATGLTGAGGLKINSSTAGAANAGAILLQGGISAGNSGSAASYFGGAVTVATGNLIIGTAGNGIDFSATAGTGTSELLNDYEEGTWDAAFVSGGGTVTINTASNRCRYTKIGRLVTVNGFLAVSSVSSPTGPLLITGLPFTIPAGTEGDASSAISIFAYNLEITATGQIVGYGLPSSSFIYLYRYEAGAIIGLAPSVKTGSEITFTLTYSV
jgi:hypothetical protein